MTPVILHLSKHHNIRLLTKSRLTLPLRGKDSLRLIFMAGKRFENDWEPGKPEFAANEDMLAPIVQLAEPPVLPASPAEYARTCC